MTKFQRISSKTVIIQPGSTVLRIGLASEEEPKIFLHCIARKSKDARPGRIPSLSSHTFTPLDIDVSNCFGSFAHSDSLVTENNFHKILNSDIAHSDQPLDDSKPAFIPFLKGLRKCVNGGYQLQWPIVSGCFNEAFTPSLNLQNLEDMWTYALEKYFGISRDEFHLYSVILVIEDVFIRREVRQIMNMLLLGLRFSRVVVQQASVCATYGVGLPTACVIDLGFQKTTISCVDEGISLPDVRVKLPIGVCNCLQTLRAAIYRFTRDRIELPELMQETDHGSFGDMRRLFNAMFDADSAIIAQMQTQSLEVIASKETTIKLATGQEVVLPNVTFLTAHLAPYFFNADGFLPEYQIPGIDAPEPDDPFDEVYSVMTMRERRRKLQGDFVPGRGDEGAFEPKSQKVSKASSFKDLAEPVLWSIRQAAVAAASTSAVDSEALGVDNVADAKGDQLRQRLFGCILLVGGGATSLGGFLLSKWLTRELQNLVGDGTSVEVLTRPQGVSDLAWQGAKLMLNTDAISDLWLTPAEWNRYGSRLLREKAPFPW
ncbi:Actin-related protein 8 [Echinococcus granulosus]|uniref:Actin protein 8 n=1 Tax=Echinococcus granulosus TaxID=6210 RepID=U6JJQ9_ECHGR|nr:Actin-related protein 8 [Echinococcus granulosus]EUB58127.1 Actin-related protein 8 [Echinococcus granulosus]KAH9286231.1 Actin-related protein 8 [Echinococcus granulosus]CDS22707.1 actin protein 8 [Echinococcus granulosus]